MSRSLTRRGGLSRAGARPCLKAVASLCATIPAVLILASCLASLGTLFSPYEPLKTVRKVVRGIAPACCRRPLHEDDSWLRKYRARPSGGGMVQAPVVRVEVEGPKLARQWLEGAQPARGVLGRTQLAQRVLSRPDMDEQRRARHTRHGLVNLAAAVCVGRGDRHPPPSRTQLGQPPSARDPSGRRTHVPGTRAVRDRLRHGGHASEFASRSTT